jgi:hypothetical protein
LAGDIRAKERAAVTLTSTGASLTTGSAGAAGTDLDARAAGNAADDFYARFQLTCQWATITSIVAGTIAADLYLVPKLDGTNLPTLDTTSGAARLPAACWAGSFECQKAPTANTDMLMVTPTVQIDPLLYTAYIVNRSGQTISANWVLKEVSIQGQYT